MYLIVDITPREGFNLVCAEPDNSGTFFVDEKYYPWQTEKLLLAMKEIVAAQGKKFSGLRGMAMSSSESFTATRAAAVLLNTIGQIHNIPVAFIEGGDLVSGADRILSKKKKFEPISPKYSRQPNITLSKKTV